MGRRISLANKCLLLFGGAVILISLTAMTVPWLRMDTLVDLGQHDLSHRLVAVWERLDAERGDGGSGVREYGGIRARRVALDDARAEAANSPFLATALKRLDRDQSRDGYQSASWSVLTREYRYARALRDEAGELVGLIVLERRAFGAARLLFLNTVYVFGAGLVVLGLALAVFYLITHHLILSPVRSLRETAERVREGNLEIRSEIRTGDEFEELAETFNAMLSEISRSHDQLRAINKAMDIKLSELSEANVALFEANRLKSEFLAGVSHELRTPLNSIIGFAELLHEIARAEADAGDDSTRLTKRIRYLDNIVTSGRDLLEMINNLLEMARIEAGKADLQVREVDLREACEGLLGLMYPQAKRKGMELTFEGADDLPRIETDPKKLQQVLFNFLSNAVKFTPSVGPDGRPGHVILRAERLVGAGGPGADDRVRLSVIDNGPGIAEADRDRLFQQFQQLDSGHTREHAGTGLGLAISRELAYLLQGEVQLVSEVGRGSMFSLILPLRFDPSKAAEASLETHFRGALAGRRTWV